MSGFELPTMTATSVAWFAWEPLTPGACMTLTALVLAAWGLWQMRTASVTRNKQLDAQEKAAADRLDAQEKAATDRHRESMRALEVLIERTARRETA